MANKLELVSLGGIPHCYNRNVKSFESTETHQNCQIGTKP